MEQGNTLIPVPLSQSAVAKTIRRTVLRRGERLQCLRSHVPRDAQSTAFDESAVLERTVPEFVVVTTNSTTELGV